MKRLFFVFLLHATWLSAQEKGQKFEWLEFNYYYGSILQHNKDIGHLITGHPEGVILSYNRRTYGENSWERLYNYPDWGFTFIYEDLKESALGHNFGLYAHYSFYFLNRSIQLKIGQGVAIASNPYDLETNFKNIAFGTRLLSSTFATLNYSVPNLYKRWGLSIGAALVHYSNGNLKSPNTSTNTFAINLGVSYDLSEQELPDFIPQGEQELKYTEPIAYNIVLRTGLNESDYVGLGQHPFVIVSAYADKRLNKKSSLNAGVDFFFSRFLKDEITFRAIAFPNDGIQGDEDWKRVGIFVGHELRFGRIALQKQLGYYLYYPYDFEGRFYQRIGLKRYFGDHYYAAVTLKTHIAKAEAVEFGFGIRLN